MSDQRSDRISLYNNRDVRDLERLRKIRDTYGLQGNYSEIGNEGNGTVRNATNRFVEFREWQYNHSEINLPVENNNIENETEKINWYDITPEQQKKIDKKNAWLNKLKGEVQDKIDELKKIERAKERETLLKPKSNEEIPDTSQKIIVNQDFNKIKKTLESLKGEVQEINTTTKLIKVIFIFQVIILILLGYILY